MGAFLKLVYMLICGLLQTTRHTAAVEQVSEYCQSEYFQQRCPNNEVILMNAAVYGRMRPGRCVTTEEAATLGDDPRYLGCSVDVLSVLDRKCTGKRECDFRVIDISDENIRPCIPGLTVYLEADYSCISIVDEKRSCAVFVTKDPVNILGSADGQRNCGTIAQPWVIQAPAGQKVRVNLFDFTSSYTNESHEQSKHICHNYGVVVDRGGKRNTTICGGGRQREQDLHLSGGNAVEIILAQPYSKEHRPDSTRFMLKLETMGCLDLVPPEDTWLKRNDDVIKIGCYSSRQVWHLNCKDGKWVGVLGNCSYGDNSLLKEESKTTISSEEQVLAMVAIGGCTLAICLAIVCLGAVCLRSFYVRNKKNQQYKTLTYQVNSVKSQHSNQRNPSNVATEYPGNFSGALNIETMPTYSVFVGDSGFSNTDNSTGLVNRANSYGQ